jgi:hypothetical protein
MILLAQKREEVKLDVFFDDKWFAPESFD